MPDAGRIEVGLRAAIHLLRSRDGSLTPLERLKLKSLLLNLAAFHNEPPPAARSTRRSDRPPPRLQTRIKGASGDR